MSTGIFSIELLEYKPFQAHVLSNINGKECWKTQTFNISFEISNEFLANDFVFDFGFLRDAFLETVKLYENKFLILKNNENLIEKGKENSYLIIENELNSSSSLQLRNFQIVIHFSNYFMKNLTKMYGKELLKIKKARLLIKLREENEVFTVQKIIE